MNDPQILAAYVSLLSPVATLAILTIGFMYNNVRLNEFRDGLRAGRRARPVPDPADRKIPEKKTPSPCNYTDAMRYLCLSISTVVLATAAFAQQGAPPTSTTLKVGDIAPDFTLPATSGKPVKLSDFRGKQNVILAFFPAAFTGGCTKEMQAYQLDESKFKNLEAAVFGVSTDNTPSQKEFAKQLNLSFPILSDFATREVSKTYGVLNADKGYDNRVTFVIDKEGKIAYMEGGKTDTTGTGEACSRLAHKSTN